jgi:diguanylate cyclase (GGDEF)-like protein
MEIRLYLQILKRGWWIIAITVLAALNTSLLVSYLTKPTYQSVSRFIVSPNASVYQYSSDVTSSMDTLDRRSIINTYKELLVSNAVYGSHPDIAKIPPEELLKKYKITAVVIPDTNILQLTVDGVDPLIITDISKAIGTQAIDYINKLYPVYNFALLDPPVIPTEPIRPKPVQNAGFGLIIGAIFGIGLALLRDQLQNTLDFLRLRSAFDNVTTAYTRQYFERLLIKEISNKPDSMLTFGLINFRGLEEVYDVLPQAMAHRVLRDVTLVLKEELRTGDVVGKWDKTQLSLFMPSTPGSAAENAFKRIQQLLATPISMDGLDEMVIHPDPCIGITEKSAGETDIDLIVETAEEAMLKASMTTKASIIYLRSKISASTPEKSGKKPNRQK